MHFKKLEWTELHPSSGNMKNKMQRNIRAVNETRPYTFLKVSAFPKIFRVVTGCDLLSEAVHHDLLVLWISHSEPAL